MEKELENEIALKELDKSFSKFAKQPRGWIAVKSFGEARPIQREKDDDFVVVEKDCARPDYGYFVLVSDTDHFGITKPKNAEDVIYQQTYSYLVSVIKAAKSAFEEEARLSLEIIELRKEEEKVKAQRIPGKHLETGFLGNLERKDAEARLQGAPVGTFLTRWSDRSNSYVLTYINSTAENPFTHIGSIRPTSDNQLQVMTHAGTETFKNLQDFVSTMITNKVISRPIAEWDYDHSPI